MRGITQEQLGNAAGCKFQQIQKYETGANRVSSSRLWEIARALDLPVSHFFEGRDDPAAPVTDRSTAELLGIFLALPESQKRALLSLARSMTGHEKVTPFAA